MSARGMSTARCACRSGTEEFHRQAVERAVAAMHRRFAEEGLGLSAIATEAISSPFHFAHFFRRISGVPPCHFLTAVRMDRAKRLLVDTELSVTTVCLEVGYSSLGTFTRRFTELVGVPPRAFRYSAQRSLSLQEVASFEDHAGAGGGGKVTGEIIAAVSGCVAVGLFPSAVPQGRPVACCLVDGPGPYQITGIPRGRYYILATELEANGSLLQDPKLRGATTDAIDFLEPNAETRVDIHLRPRNIVDPPIVLAVPLLLSIGAPARAAAER